MKNFILSSLISLLCLSPVFSLIAFTEPPEDVISINFGNVVSAEENTGAILSCQNWNILYKGNSAYLLNEKNQQSSCYLKTNTFGSLINKFNLSEFAITKSYLDSQEENIHLTFYDIPYKTYKVYVYLVQPGKSMSLPVIVNGLSYDASIVDSEEYSSFCVIQANTQRKLELSFHNDLCISAVQIVQSNENKNLSPIPKNSLKSIVYPTCVEETLYLDMSGLSLGEYTVEIIDNAGRVIKSLNLAVVSPSYIFQIELDNLPKGIYMVSISGSHTNVCEQVVIK